VARATEDLFAADTKYLSKMTAVELYLHFHRLFKRILDQSESREECQLAITAAAVRHYSNPEGGRYLYFREARTQGKLVAALRSYKETAEGGLVNGAHKPGRK